MASGVDLRGTLPTVGRIVLYRSVTGSYTLPAIVTATVGSIFEPGVAEGGVPPLTGDDHVHLHVFTPGAQGGYQEFDVPPMRLAAGDVAYAREDGTLMIFGSEVQDPRTWAWPARSPADQGLGR